MATRNGQLDTRIEVVTPENISFEYRVAGPFRRYLAYLIDLTLRTFVFVLLYFAVMLPFSAVGLYGFGFAIVVIIWFISSWFYGGLLETYWNGQTVGKRLLGIRVLTMDGQPINGLQLSSGFHKFGLCLCIVNRGGAITQGILGIFAGYVHIS